MPTEDLTNLPNVDTTTETLDGQLEKLGYVPPKTAGPAGGMMPPGAGMGAPPPAQAGPQGAPPPPPGGGVPPEMLMQMLQEGGGMPPGAGGGPPGENVSVPPGTALVNIDQLQQLVQDAVHQAMNEGPAESGSDGEGKSVTESDSSGGEIEQLRGEVDQIKQMLTAAMGPGAAPGPAPAPAGGQEGPPSLEVPPPDVDANQLQQMVQQLQM